MSKKHDKQDAERTSNREQLFAEDAPAAIGPYSHAVWSGKELFLSGQTPIDPSVGTLIEGDVEAQTHRCFDNLEAVLHAADLSLDDVVKCNVYLTDMGDFAAMNRAYGARFIAPYPARTTVAVAALPLGAAVEIECLARRAR
jgi:2-iminobutanoate/2-iminopropanoate deaminase